MLTKILLIAGLLFVFYQDMRYRAVYWVLFPLLFVLLMALAIQQQPLTELAINSSYNLGFLLVQFILLTVYFSVKSRQPVNITSGYLGWGDVLFLVCITCYLSPGNYLFFYMLSLLIVLLIIIGIYSFSKVGEVKIPLAGMQAVLFALLLMVDWYFDAINFTSDSWLITYFG